MIWFKFEDNAVHLFDKNTQDNLVKYYLVLAYLERDKPVLFLREELWDEQAGVLMAVSSLPRFIWDWHVWQRSLRFYRFSRQN